MKKIFKLLLIISLISTLSCNENEWLTEKPLDFYAPENSFNVPGDFNSALAKVYLQTGVLMNSGNDASLVFDYPSDVCLDNHGLEHELNSYRNKLIPENNRVSGNWTACYRIIFDCNVIMNRIDNVNIKFADEKQRNIYKAEAAFLRGFAYRLLAILYGGVPIVLEEVTSPKRDFVRSSIQDTWKQIIKDYTFAAQNLPAQSELKVDGRLTKGAAYHALAEAYIINKEWDNAINAATTVISSPDYALMTTRFGTWKDKPGDVYYDLFRRGNVNYKGKAGINKEAIWVDQYEYLVPGGGHSNQITRFLGSTYWQLVGNDGKNLFFGHSSQNGGRGIGWLIPTPYVLTNIWNDPNDIRNSSYNIIRDVKADNPASAYYGQFIVASGSFTKFNNALNRWWSAIFTKTAPVNDFPAETLANPATGATTTAAIETFNDTYYFRLAETYLLRAEAYLGKGDKDKAASDINAVRTRAKASLVEASKVNINYILDERARELYFEEKRVLTLMRLGMQKERVDTYNIMSKDQIIERNILWPIPQSEIERNTEAKLEQNPGY